MKNLLKLLGIIVFIAIIGFSMISCEEDCRWCKGSGDCSMGGADCNIIGCNSCYYGACSRCGGTGKVNYALGH